MISLTSLLAWFRWGVTMQLEDVKQTLQTLVTKDEFMAAIDDLKASEARIAADLEKANARLDELKQRDVDLAAQLAAALAAGDTTAINAAVQVVADKLNADAAGVEQHLAADADPAPPTPAVP